MFIYLILEEIATIFSWFYFLRNKNSVFYYLFGHQYEIKIKQGNLTRDEFLNGFITSKTILYSLIINFLAILLFINVVLLLFT